MDLTIGTTIYREVATVDTIDPHNADSINRHVAIDNLRGHTRQGPFYTTYALGPQARILCSAQEDLDLDDDEIGLVSLRSTWARLGLIAPPTVVNPGFCGNLTMELFNSNQFHSILLRPGFDKIWNFKRLYGKTHGEADTQHYAGFVGVKLPDPLT